MSDLPNARTFALFARSANKKIILEIEESGDNLILFPNVETQIAEFNSEGENTLKNLSDFDWIVFPDVFAAEYFLQALGKFEVDFFELDALRIAAFGESVSDRLRFSQIHADVISNSVETFEVIQAVENYEIDLTSKRFIIPKEISCQLEIANSLTERGVAVWEFPVYQFEISETASITKLKTLLKGGAVDEIIFCSPAEILEFSFIFPSEKPADLLREIQITATDSATFQSLREFGLNKIKMRQPGFSV